MNLNKTQQRALVLDYALACANPQREDQILSSLAGRPDAPARSMESWTHPEILDLNRRVRAFMQRHNFTTSVLEEMTPPLRIFRIWYDDQDVQTWFDENL